MDGFVHVSRDAVDLVRRQPSEGIVEVAQEALGLDLESAQEDERISRRFRVDRSDPAGAETKGLVRIRVRERELDGKGPRQVERSTMPNPVIPGNNLLLRPIS